jgi:hypothetical protein
VVEAPANRTPSDAEIADAARLALRTHAGTIYLSRLGQDLRQAFGANFKIALGTRTLGDFVNEHLSDTYEVWGRGPFKRVGVLGSASDDDAPPSRKKYLDAVWKAFSTPGREGHRRWITIGPPLSYVDAQDAPTKDSVEISPDLIVVEDGRPRRERADAIGTSIRLWAETAGIPSSNLEEAPSETTPSKPRRADNANGADALRRLIAVIPEEERARYSLPMNLIGRLLQVP